MSFLMKDKENYNEIWEKYSNMIKKTFNCELIYDKKYLKAEKNLITRKSTQKNISLYLYISDIDYFSLYER